MTTRRNQMVTPTSTINPESATVLSHDAFTTRELILLALLSVILILSVDIIFYPSTLEDSFITFRYAKHLAEGYGFGAWNTVGERVEGYTSFSWMLVLAAAHYFGINILTAAKILGILLHVLLILFLFMIPRLSKRHYDSRYDFLGNPNTAVLAGVFLAAYLPLSWYATSGMETVAFTTLVALVFFASSLRYGSLILTVAGALLILTRPEGLLFAGAGVMLVWLQRKHRDEAVFDVYIAAIVLFLTAFGVLIYRLIQFGDFVPNTYWAKVGGSGLLHIEFGIKYVIYWVKNHSVVVLLFFVAVATLFTRFTRRGDKRALLCDASIISLVSVYVLYIIKVGGDNLAAFPYWRHFVHISPVIIAIACYGICRILPQNRYFHLAIVVTVVLLVDACVLFGSGGLYWGARQGLQRYPSLVHVSPNPYYVWLKNVTDSKALIASTFAGELPYVVDAVHIDILGLNTRHIAKHGEFDPKGPQDSKTDMNWVLEQKPDIVEGFVSAEKIGRGVSGKVIVNQWRSKMNVELVSSPIFQREYMFLVNGPYRYMDRALFFKRSYWEKHPKKFELNCIPISETSLASFGGDSHNKSMNIDNQ